MNGLCQSLIGFLVHFVRSGVNILTLTDLREEIEQVELASEGKIAAGVARLRASTKVEPNPKKTQIETTTHPSVGCVNVKD